MKTLKNACITILSLVLISCSTKDTPNNGNGIPGGGGGSNPSSTWLIPINEVKDGGPGKDGIPSIDTPVFEIASETNSIADDELIIGIKRGNVVKAYPHYILDWHEIVNDVVGTTNTTISYCPLTGTAFAWRSLAGGSFSNFGVSGLLYNTNLILYDRATDSNWSQILQQCVNGESIGEVPEKLSIIESDWKTWKASFPNSLVLTEQTGFDKPYGTYPYPSYRTNHNFFLFTPSPLNPALPNKQRVFAVLDNTTKSRVFKFSDFIGGNAIRDTFFNSDYLIVGDENLIVAFKVSGTISNLTFTYDYDETETFFKDNEGNKWNMFGDAIEGPRTGQKLSSAKSVTSMWFAVAAFFPNPDIYSE